MFSGGSSLPMASSEPLVTTERLIFLFSSSIRHYGREWVPNLICVSVRACHPHYPDGPANDCASPTALVFAVSAEARHPYPRARWFSRGCVTRLIQVRLRYGLHDCLPFTNKDFYGRAFAGRVTPNRRRL
jgi:hypothetical protein